MLAAYHGHADLVRLLISHGADPNRLNDRGQSPLAGAVFKKEDAVIDVSAGRTSRRAEIEKLDMRSLTFGRFSLKAALTQTTGNPVQWSASPCSSRRIRGKINLRLLQGRARRSRRRRAHPRKQLLVLD
jgi:hypothetical protein